MATDWGVEWFRVCFTGVFAFGGAWGGFLLANRGRKIDILYKEQYNSFAVMADNMAVLRNSLEVLIVNCIDLDREDISNVHKTTGVAHLNRNLSIIKGVADKHSKEGRFLILLNKDIRKEYEDVIFTTANLCMFCREYIIAEPSELQFAPTKRNYDLSATNDLVSLSEAVISSIDKITERAYGELGFPSTHSKRIGLRMKRNQR